MKIVLVMWWKSWISAWIQTQGQDFVARVPSLGILGQMFCVQLHFWVSDLRKEATLAPSALGI